MAELAADERSGTVEALKEIFADPLLAGEVASPTELGELADAAPNAARGVVRLHAAWREALERLSDLSQGMAREGGEASEIGARLPVNAASAYFEATSPWFGELESAAEELAARLSPRDDPAQALRAHLREAHGIDVRILPGHVMPLEQARYDRHSQRLFLSERVPLVERPLLMARQAALIGARELLDRLAAGAAASSDEAARLVRAGFARRLAEATLAPARRLTDAARDLGARRAAALGAFRRKTLAHHGAAGRARARGTPACRPPSPSTWMRPAACCRARRAPASPFRASVRSAPGCRCSTRSRPAGCFTRSW